MSDGAMRRGPDPEEPVGPDDATLPRLDQIDAERLLDGVRVPADSQPVLGGLADLLAAAAGPPRPDELAGEASVLAAFQTAKADARRTGAAPAVPPEHRASFRRPSPARAGRPAAPGSIRPPLGQPAGAPRNPGRPRRRMPLARTPAALVALLVIVGGLCATAAATVLTVTVDRPARSVAGTGRPAAPRSSIVAIPGRTEGSATTGAGSATGATSTTIRAGAMSAADRAKLCAAWFEGKKPKHGKGFESLAAAAGGAERIEAYCRSGSGEPGGRGSAEPGPSDGSVPSTEPSKAEPPKPTPPTSSLPSDPSSGPGWEPGHIGQDAG